MQQVNVFQLQLNASQLKKTFQEQKVSFSSEQLHLLQTTLTEYLGGANFIEISNKHVGVKSDDGFVTLHLSIKGITLLKVSSLKRTKTTFLIKDNTLVINDREVNLSFLDTFLAMITRIIAQVESGKFSIRKG